MFFFAIFQHKNIENTYFDQHLECAAPKRWLKYTANLLCVCGNYLTSWNS